MLRSKWVLVGLIALAVLPPATRSFASGTYVLGDSMGDGWPPPWASAISPDRHPHTRPQGVGADRADAARLDGLHLPRHQRRRRQPEKYRQEHRRYLDAAAQRQLTVIWVGPHCVRKAWDKQAGEFEDIAQPSAKAQAPRYQSNISARGMRPSARENSKSPTACISPERLSLYVGDDRWRVGASARPSPARRKNRPTPKSRITPKNRTPQTSQRHRSRHGRRRHASTIAWSWKSTFPARRRSPGVDPESELA